MKETEIVGSFSVCELLKLESSYFKNDEDTPNEGIDWKVKIEGLDDKVKLEEFKEEGIIKGESKLSGSVISFVVPIEWGQKTVTFYCYLNTDENILSPGVTVKIKDHIVAAFYRINTKSPKPFNVTDIKLGGGTNNLLKREPVYHNQGLYKDTENGTLYVSVSVGGKDNNSYIYMLNEVNKKNEQYVYTGKTDFGNNGLNLYKHPGGIQIAHSGNKKILAVGFEKYGGLDMATSKRSIISFFDVENKYEEIESLCIINDDSFIGKARDLPHNKNKIINDFASAMGIVFIRRVFEKDGKGEDLNKFLVVSRGGNRALRFFLIDENCTVIENIPQNKTFDQVGEFQNINLVLDENNNVYMVGFESRKKTLGDGTQTNFAWLYKLDIDFAHKIISIKSAWIDNNGYINEEKDYQDKEVIGKNEVKVITNNLASFQWASCIHLDNTKHTKGTGFLRKFTMYAVGSSVEYEEDYDQKKDLAEYTYSFYCKDFEYNKAIYKVLEVENELQEFEYQYTLPTESRYDYDQYPYIKSRLTFEEYRHRTEYMTPVNTRIQFNSFTED